MTVKAWKWVATQQRIYPQDRDPLYLNFSKGMPLVTSNIAKATAFRTRTDCIAHLQEWELCADYLPISYPF